MKIIWIVFIFLLAGCTVTQPHITEYTLAPLIDKQEYSAIACREKTLKVGQVFSSKALMSQNMKYTQEKYNESVFNQSAWARTPNRAISDSLVKSIRASELFLNVSSFKSRVKTDLLLETHVEELMQYFNVQEEKSYVALVFTFNLMERKSLKSVAHKTFSIKVDATSMDAKAGVIALNSALSEIFIKTNIWLNGVCK